MVQRGAWVLSGLAVLGGCADDAVDGRYRASSELPACARDLCLRFDEAGNRDGHVGTLDLVAMGQAGDLDVARFPDMNEDGIRDQLDLVLFLQHIDVPGGKGDSCQAEYAGCEEVWPPTFESLDELRDARALSIEGLSRAQGDPLSAWERDAIGDGELALDRVELGDVPYTLPSGAVVTPRPLVEAYERHLARYDSPVRGQVEALVRAGVFSDEDPVMMALAESYIEEIDGEEFRAGATCEVSCMLALRPLANSPDYAPGTGPEPDFVPPTLEGFDSCSEEVLPLTPGDAHELVTRCDTLADASGAKPSRAGVDSLRRSCRQEVDVEVLCAFSPGCTESATCELEGWNSVFVGRAVTEAHADSAVLQPGIAVDTLMRGRASASVQVTASIGTFSSQPDGSLLPDAPALTLEAQAVDGQACAESMDSWVVRVLDDDLEETYSEPLAPNLLAGLVDECQIKVRLGIQTNADPVKDELFLECSKTLFSNAVKNAPGGSVYVERTEGGGTGLRLCNDVATYAGGSSLVTMALPEVDEITEAGRWTTSLGDPTQRFGSTTIAIEAQSRATSRFELRYVNPVSENGVILWEREPYVVGADALAVDIAASTGMTFRMRGPYLGNGDGTQPACAVTRFAVPVQYRDLWYVPADPALRYELSCAAVDPARLSCDRDPIGSAVGQYCGGGPTECAATWEDAFGATQVCEFPCPERTVCGTVCSECLDHAPCHEGNDAGAPVLAECPVGACTGVPEDPCGDKEACYDIEDGARLLAYCERGTCLGYDDDPCGEGVGCYGIDGNNTTCSWDCPAPRTCGEACGECVARNG